MDVDEDRIDRGEPDARDAGLTAAAPAPPRAPKAEAPTPRFCGTCGTPREHGSLLCQACADRATAASLARPAIALSEEGQPIASALGLYFIFLASSLIGFMIISATEEEAIAATVELAIVIFDTFLVLIWSVRSWHEISPGLRRVGDLVWYPAAAAGAVGTFVIASAVVGFVNLVADLPEMRYSDPLLDAGYGWIGVILLVCVQPAVIEELAFRGVILSGMSRVMAVRDAIIVSAAMFMIIHLSALSFPHLLLIGLVLGYLRVRTGSLYPGMLLHFVHNGLVVWEEAGGWLPW